MKISVLMSVYNENEREIKESVESILLQTLKDFEFIIVNDNPNRKDLHMILNYYSQIDNRIIVITNSSNIGLALSLNKAAYKAKGKYLARMDADDVSSHLRFEYQYNVISSENCDVVFSDYYYIDESSKISKRKNYYTGFSNNKVQGIVPLKSIIHHPTVMMNHTIFNEVGGYRNFPCAQDQDLWFRMWEIGGSFYMINQKLLKYRLRSGSTSIYRQYQQKLTIDYIQDLFIQRLLRKHDNYSLNRYHDYLSKHGVNNRNKILMMKKSNNLLEKALILKDRNNHILSFLLRFFVFFYSDTFRRSFVAKTKIYLLLSLNHVNYRKHIMFIRKSRFF